MSESEDFAHNPATEQWDKLWTPAPSEWFTKAPSARRWLLRDSRRADSAGVFPLGKAGQLVAAGGVGKTMVLCGLALAVAKGERWLDTFDVGEPGTVLMFLGEEDEEECHRRLYNACKGQASPPRDSITVVPLAGKPSAFLETGPVGPMETDFYLWVRRQIEVTKPRLVILDPMSRFAGLDAEKDNAISTRFVQCCEALTTSESAVINAHHTPQITRGKAGDDIRGRGVTALRDGFRWEGALGSTTEHGVEVVRLTNTKSNYSRKFEPLLLERQDGGMLTPMAGGDAAEFEDAGRERREREEAKRAERARNHADKSRLEEQERARKKAQAEREMTERIRLDDEAYATLRGQLSGARVRDILAEFKRIRHANQDRFYDAQGRYNVRHANGHAPGTT